MPVFRVCKVHKVYKVPLVHKVPLEHKVFRVLLVLKEIWDLQVHKEP